MYPRIIFYNSDTLFMTFPPETTLPSNPVCITGPLLSMIACSSPSLNRLKVKFTFNFPLLTTEYQLAFNITNIRNPSSTKQTLAFYDVEAFDINGYLIAFLAEIGPTIKN